MRSITLTCPCCRQSTHLRRDADTGLWQMPNGYASISNLSWKYLEKMWLGIHAQSCGANLKTRMKTFFVQGKPV